MSDGKGANGKAPRVRPDTTGREGRRRPPGPEERRGATATSGKRPDNQQGLRALIRTPRFWITLLVLLLVNWLLAPFLLPEVQDRVTLPYTFFKQQVTAGNVSEITSRGDDIQGLFRQAVNDPNPPEGQPAQPYTKFATIKPAFDDPELLSLLEKNSVVITAKSLDQPRSPLLNLLLAFGPAVLLIGGFIWLSSRATRAATGGVFGMGRSGARRYDAGDGTERITFEDVAGIDEVEAELVEIVDFLKLPDKYQRLGGRIPKGVLLVGPPGTGKTLLARAVAGEAAVPFFSMSGSEFIEMVVGVGAARVRDLFAEARKAAPAIVFIDELDAIGRRRGGANSIGGNDEREQTLNQILVEMDGFDTDTNIVIIAATNRPDILDPALMRPGRFDRKVVVDRPDRRGREAILKVHARGKPLAPDIDLSVIASQTAGMVGADLENLVNEAAILAARRNKRSISMSEMVESIERVMAGPARRSRVLDDNDRRIVAYHEAGHAIVMEELANSEGVGKITIVSRGQALGYVMPLPDEDKNLRSRAEYVDSIAGLLAGRVAEEIIFHEPSTSAANDLERVTKVAKAMVTRFGMSEVIGLLQLQHGDANPFMGMEIGEQRTYSEDVARKIDREVRRIIDQSYAHAREILMRRKDQLILIAETLLEKEVLDRQEFLRLFDNSNTALSVIAAAPES